MIKMVLDNATQVAITKAGLQRAINYIPQWEGVTIKRNYQHDRERLNFPAFVAQQSEALGAEVAVSQYFRKPIDLENLNYKLTADVGQNIEVKWTKYKDGSLILTELDRKEDVAILVTGSMPTYWVCGWTPISMARRPSHQRSDGTWWVGQDDLHPMANFHRSIYADHVSMQG
jgi:hypothetical protein